MQASTTIEIGINVSAAQLEHFNRSKEEKKAKINKKQEKEKKKEEKKKRKELEKRKKKGIQKTEIGAPQNFRHLSHSGLDGNFEADDIPPEYKELLKKLNVKKSDWKDPTKRQIIVEKVNEVINEAVETDGAESVDRDLMRIGSTSPKSEEPPLNDQPNSSIKTASPSRPPPILPPPPPPPPMPLPSPPPTPPPTPASSFVAESSMTTIETAAEMEEEEKAEAQEPMSELASMLSSVQLKKTAPPSEKPRPAEGRDAALEGIRQHPGLKGLRHVEKVNDRSNVSLTKSAPSGSLEDHLRRAIDDLSEKLTGDGDEDSTGSDWSSDED